MPTKLFIFGDIKLVVAVGEPSAIISGYFWLIILFQLKAERRHIFSLSSVSSVSIPWPLFHVNSVGHLNVSLDEVVGWGRELQPFKNWCIPIVLGSYCLIWSQDGKQITYHVLICFFTLSRFIEWGLFTVKGLYVCCFLFDQLKVMTMMSLWGIQMGP